MGRKILVMLLTVCALLALSVSPASANHRGGFTLDTNVDNDGHRVRMWSDHKIVDITIETCDGHLLVFGWRSPEIQNRYAEVSIYPDVAREVWVHMKNIDEDDGTGRGIPATGQLDHFCS